MPAAGGVDPHGAAVSQRCSRGPVNRRTGKVVAVVDIVGERVIVTRRQSGIPARPLPQMLSKGPIERPLLQGLQRSGMPGVERQQRHGRPTGSVEIDVAMGSALRGEDIVEPRHGISRPQPLDRLDPAELLHVGRGLRHWSDGQPRETIGIRLEAVGSQQLGDAFGVPGGRVEIPQRDRKGVHTFVQQQVPPIGIIGLIYHPEAVAFTEAVAEIGHAVGQEPRRAKPFAIDDQAAEGSPLAVVAWVDSKVAAPGGKCLVEHPRQLIHPVAGSCWAIGHQGEVCSLDHPQAGPLGRCPQGGNGRVCGGSGRDQRRHPGQHHDGMTARDRPPIDDTTCDHEENVSNPQSCVSPRRRGKACGIAASGWMPSGRNSDRILRRIWLQTPPNRQEGVACGKDAEMGSRLEAAGGGSARCAPSGPC